MKNRFRSSLLNNRALSIRNLRKLTSGCRVMLTCAGGCGKTHVVRVGKIGPGHVFVCNDRATRDQCRRNVPLVLDNGAVQILHHQSAGCLTGVTYRNKGPKATAKAIVKSLIRAFVHPFPSRMGRTARR